MALVFGDGVGNMTSNAPSGATDRIPREGSHGRLRYVDALRGIASIGVLSHHLLVNSVLEVPLRHVLPASMLWLQEFAKYGVQVFFVLSGFVILLSLSSLTMTAANSGRFILRRQLRLDPPYWAMIMIAIAAAAFEPVLGFATTTDLSVGVVLANMFYLQNILGVQEILGVAWTLCLEVQFYLIVIVLLLAAGRLTQLRTLERQRENRYEAQGPYVPSALFLTGVASLISSWYLSPQVASTWAIGQWHYFAMGALLYLAMFRPRRSTRTLATLMVASEVLTFAFDPLQEGRLPTAAGLLAVAFLYGCFRSPRAAKVVSENRPLQYLGSRSYSIYLVHLTTLSIVMRVGYKITGDSPGAAVGWMVLATPVCLVAAELLYRVAERPAMRLSNDVRTRGLRSAVRSRRDALAVRFSH